MPDVRRLLKVARLVREYLVVLQAPFLCDANDLCLRALVHLGLRRQVREEVRGGEYVAAAAAAMASAATFV